MSSSLLSRHSDDQLGALSNNPYERKLVGRSAPRRIFGPSVTTTDEESDYDGMLWLLVELSFSIC